MLCPWWGQGYIWHMPTGTVTGRHQATSEMSVELEVIVGCWCVYPLEANSGAPLVALLWATLERQMVAVKSQ